jgi:hypothetical protein
MQLPHSLETAVVKALCEAWYSLVSKYLELPQFESLLLKIKLHRLQQAKKPSKTSFVLLALGFMKEISLVFSESEHVVVTRSGFKIQADSEDENSSQLLALLAEFAINNKAESVVPLESSFSKLQDNPKNSTQV